MITKFRSLSVGKKILLGAGAFVAMAAMIGSASPDSSTKQVNVQSASANSSADKEESKAAEVQVKTVQETQAIPYKSVTKDDPSLDSGETVVVKGVNGQKTITYRVTYTGGVETDRKQVSEVINQQPIDEVTKVGTKAPAAASCDPNYSGACVPVAYDVDCASGSGDGPAYVSGPIYVTGTDIYDLDRDGDGVGCD